MIITIEYDMCYMILQYVDGLNSAQVDQTMVLSSGKSCYVCKPSWCMVSTDCNKTLTTLAMVSRNGKS